MASSGTSAANFLAATTPSSTKVQVKANKKPNFVIPGRTNGIVPSVPKLGNTFRKHPGLLPAGNLPVAITPASGSHGRGLGGTKGGRRRRGKMRKTHRRRK